ncbi:MAG: hypothetical protein E7317_00080 [Clostridiales bacterium]|nr:hypothetical protein [Clostridiales bacterium]
MRKGTGTVRAAKYGYIVMSLLSCLLGVVMLARADFTPPYAGVAVAALLAAFGVIKLIGYFSGDIYSLAFQFDLGAGILMLALAAVLLAAPGVRSGFLCALVGVALLAESLGKIQTALDARRFGLDTWWLILALAVLSGAAAFLPVLNLSRAPEALRGFLGAALILGGAMDLAVSLCAVRVVRHHDNKEV